MMAAFGTLEPYSPPLGIRGNANTGLGRQQYEQTLAVMTELVHFSDDIPRHTASSLSQLHLAFRSNFATSAKQIQRLDAHVYKFLLEKVMEIDQPTSGCLNCEALERSWSIILGCRDVQLSLHRQLQQPANMWSPILHRVCYDSGSVPIVKLRTNMSKEQIITSIHIALIFRWDLELSSTSFWSQENSHVFQEWLFNSNGINLRKSRSQHHHLCKTSVHLSETCSEGCSLRELMQMAIVESTCVLELDSIILQEQTNPEEKDVKQLAKYSAEAIYGIIAGKRFLSAGGETFGEKSDMIAAVN